MPHPVHIMPGIISLPSHVSMTESIDIIELDEASFAWQQTSSHVHCRSNNGLFKRAIVWISKRLAHHRAQRLRCQELSVQSEYATVNKWRLQYLGTEAQSHIAVLIAVTFAHTAGLGPGIGRAQQIGRVRKPKDVRIYEQHGFTSR